MIHRRFVRADPADALIPDSARVHDQTLTGHDTTTWKSGLTATFRQLHRG